ncbi:hypothetical protein OFC38_31380, partial [Escherichia coli]|nr:hypothetical protein [Escherichia coli]
RRGTRGIGEAGARAESFGTSRWAGEDGIDGGEWANGFRDCGGAGRFAAECVPMALSVYIERDRRASRKMPRDRGASRKYRQNWCGRWCG